MEGEYGFSIFLQWLNVTGKGEIVPLQSKGTTTHGKETSLADEKNSEKTRYQSKTCPETPSEKSTREKNTREIYPCRKKTFFCARKIL